MTTRTTPRSPCQSLAQPSSPPSSSRAVAGPSKITRIQIPPALAHFQEPGSTGYVPKTTLVKIPANLAHFQEPGSVGYVPAATVSTSGGLDWASALIGAGVALGVALASAGAFTVLRRRRTLAHT